MILLKEEMSINLHKLRVDIQVVSKYLQIQKEASFACLTVVYNILV